MNWHSIKGYFLILVSGAAIFAAILLMVMNGGAAKAEFSLYGDLRPVNLGLLMAFCALGGVLLLFFAMLLVSGIRSVKRGRDASRSKAPSDPGQDPSANS